LDPDEQAQRVIRFIFEPFEAQGSLHGWLRYLVTHDIRVPMRPPSGPNRGQLVWRRPTRLTFPNMLHHPSSAGTYRWGHRKIAPRQQQPGRRRTGRTINVPEACDVLIPQRFPAYRSGERLVAIQRRLAANRAIADALGAPREGPSLLAGVLVCGRCGRRLMAAYGGKANHLRYTCRRATIDDGAPGCLSLAGAFLARFVTTQIMPVLQPASLALSVAAEQALRAARERFEAHWQQRLERAPYTAQRATRQYEAVEPENRLVARALERRWAEALSHEHHLQAEYARFRRERPPELTSRAREAILRLAHDIPA
jgi:hypothetical protein